MADDRPSIDQAAHRERSVDREPIARGGYTQTRVERLFEIAVALIGIVFGTQSLVLALTEDTGLEPGVGGVAVTVVHGLLGVAIMCGFIGRCARLANAVFAIAFLALLVVWLFWSDPATASLHPWPWLLCSLAAASAVQAWPIGISSAYVAVSGIGYGAVQLVTLPNDDVTHGTVLIDTSYVLVIGYAVVILWMIFCNAATAVDRARHSALEEYDEAVRANRLSAERVEADALIHDSVLTALQLAARSDGEPVAGHARALAASSIAVLTQSFENESWSTNRWVDEQEFRRLVRSRMSEVSPVFEYVEQPVDAEFDPAATVGRGEDPDASEPFDEPDSAPQSRAYPSDVCEALIGATTQAVVNSMRHAGTGMVERTVTLTTEPDAIRMVIADTGRGFDSSAVATERLGIRVSIIERMASVGGRVVVRTSPGAGVRIELSWDRTGCTAGELDAT